ncbi:hypothetical protein SAMD00019534_004020 [Acytostelium subglobosum LB1]|uniref:hypothetical protein n=1 Tax=Acytostelium subglobosum LB1 TaxID=1410327 RepID=UPI000644C533|nr:hypothetical protein SAMD00019534_004020 [Acytostelium subglobosum LB1]GAM17227.1 hypothetical protein SAMD00019534_004020 [Acytostelium subglobosum LB1]|eukprot:XP_012759289.1 hypothetical protein SAMD00019534_004020 [Acytostelium subglobosum LB1]
MEKAEELANLIVHTILGMLAVSAKATTSVRTSMVGRLSSWKSPIERGALCFGLVSALYDQYSGEVVSRTTRRLRKYSLIE